MSVCFPTNKTKEDEKKTTEWKFRCLNLRSLCWEGVGGKSHVDISRPFASFHSARPKKNECPQCLNDYLVNLWGTVGGPVNTDRWVTEMMCMGTFGRWVKQTGVNDAILFFLIGWGTFGRWVKQTGVNDTILFFLIG